MKLLLRLTAFIVMAQWVPAAALPVLPSQALDAFARRVWHTEDGLPEETVQALTQTPDHFLWIATTGGLVRFDGAQFTTFDRASTPALRDSAIFCLTVSKDGSLWIGTEGAGLVSYRAGQFRAWGGDADFTSSHVRAISEDREGELWVGTDHGLFQKHGETFVRVEVMHGVPKMGVHAVYRDSQSRLWVGGFRLIALSNGRATEYVRAGGPNDNVKSIVESSDRTIWVGTVSGLQRMSPGETSFSRVAAIHSTVRSLREGRGGALWIATIGEGLFLYSQGKFSRYSAPEMLPSNTILSTFEDSERNVWLGTQTGLLRLSRTALNTFALPNASDADFGTIYEDHDGALWIAGTRVYKFEGGRFVEQHFPPPLDSTRIRNVFRDSSGALWIGTEGRGAFRLVHGKPEPVTGTNAYIRVFVEDRDGSILIGTDEGVNRWRRETGAVPLGPGSIHALLIDGDRNVWVGKDQGLDRLHDGVSVSDSVTERLRTEQVWAIHQDTEGALWFGTRYNGMFRWKAGRLTAYTTAQGLATNSIYQILEDRRGRFWMSGPNGISSVARHDLDQIAEHPEYRPAVKLYGTSDGLLTTQMYGGVQPAGCLTSSGEVWFPSSKGPVRIGSDPDLPENPPPAFIYKVVADGRLTATSGEVLLKPGEGKLDIDYGAIQLRSPERVRFRYKLEGFDRDWTESLGTHDASYTNLPPGQYRFRVRAFDMNRPGDTSEVTLPIRWRAHFYQSDWFLLFCVLAVLGAAWCAHYLHIRQTRMRFQAVLDERSRLAREMHDTLIQGCTSVSALLEASSSLQNVAPEVNQQLIDHARTQVRATIEDARRAVWNLRHQPPSSSGEAGGTLSRISEIARQVSRQSNISVTCEATGAAVALDDETDHHLLLVVREALFNAVRHGHPTDIQVTLAFEDKRLRVQVVDNGCGFDSASALDRPPGHYGIVGMRERVEHVGGALRVNSNLGRGTIVEIEVPFRNPHSAKEIGDREPQRV